MAKVSINLTKIRIEQAYDDLNVCQTLYNLQMYKAANNRAYYSIFHTMRAILFLEPRDYKRHKDVIAYFNQNYINKEIFPRTLGHRIKNAEIIRDNSDYNDFYIVSKDDTEEVMKTANDLYEYALKYIREWCKNSGIDFETAE